jgi:hypothetical protein
MKTVELTGERERSVARVQQLFGKGSAKSENGNQTGPRHQKWSGYRRATCFTWLNRLDFEQRSPAREPILLSSKRTFKGITKETLEKGRLEEKLE